MEFTPNCIYQQLILDAPERFILAIAGAQAGKTTIGAVWFVNLIGENYAARSAAGDEKPRQWMICVPKYGTFEQSTQAKFEEFLPKDWCKDGFKAQRKCYDLVWGDKIFVRSMDEPESMEGATLSGSWMDEFGDMPEEAWIYMQARLARYRGRCIMTTTPYLGKFWVKKAVYHRAGRLVSNDNGDCHDKKIESPDSDPNILAVKWKTKDNPALDPQDIERQRAFLTPEMFELRYEAEFTSPQGLVYKSFTDDDIIKPFAIPDEWRKFGGVDFGFGSTTAAVCVAEKPLEPTDKPGTLPTFYVYRELYRKGVFLEQLAMFLNQERMGRVLGDPRGAQEMAELSRVYGVQHLGKADNSVIPGCEKINSLFQQKRLKVFSSCPETILELREYHHKSENSNKDSDGLPAKVHDHAVDSLRYAFSRDSSKVYHTNPRSIKYQVMHSVRPVARRSTMGQADRFTGY